MTYPVEIVRQNLIPTGYVMDENKIRLFDVSCGNEQFVDRCADQVDHIDKGICVSVASGSGLGGLEQTV